MADLQPTIEALEELLEEGGEVGRELAAAALAPPPFQVVGQGLPTPWPTLTASIQGFMPGRLYHFYGEEGIGKTTFAVNLFHWFMVNLPPPLAAVYVGVEPSRQEIVARLIALEFGDPYTRWTDILFRDDPLEEDAADDWGHDLLLAAQHTENLLPLHPILELGGVEAANLDIELAAALRYLQRNGVIPRIIILDTWTAYIESREAVPLITARRAAHALLGMAKEFNASVITIGHTRKSDPSRPSHTPYKCPTRDAERGAKALRMVATVVAGMWRDKPDQPEAHTFLYLHKNHTPGTRGNPYISLRYEPCERLTDDPGCVPPGATEGGLGEPTRSICQALLRLLEGAQGRWVNVFPRLVAQEVGLPGQQPGRRVTAVLQELGVPINSRQRRRDKDNRTYYSIQRATLEEALRRAGVL